MQWTVALAVYLTALRWSFIIILPLTGFALYLAGIAAVRIKWGHDKGALVVTLLSALLPSCLAAAAVAVWWGIVGGLFVFPFCFLVGLLCGFYSFLVVSNAVEFYSNHVLSQPPVTLPSPLPRSSPLRRD